MSRAGRPCPAGRLILTIDRWPTQRQADREEILGGRALAGLIRRWSGKPASLPLPSWFPSTSGMSVSRGWRGLPRRGAGGAPAPDRADHLVGPPFRGICVYRNVLGGVNAKLNAAQERHARVSYRIACASEKRSWIWKRRLRRRFRRCRGAFWSYPSDSCARCLAYWSPSQWRRKPSSIGRPPPPRPGASSWRLSENWASSR